MMNEAIIEPFETSLRGELLRPESDGYGEARGLWNGMSTLQLHGTSTTATEAKK